MRMLMMIVGFTGMLGACSAPSPLPAGLDPIEDTTVAVDVDAQAPQLDDTAAEDKISNLDHGFAHIQFSACATSLDCSFIVGGHTYNADDGACTFPLRSMTPPSCSCNGDAPGEHTDPYADGCWCKGEVEGDPEGLGCSINTLPQGGL